MRELPEYLVRYFAGREPLKQKKSATMRITGQACFDRSETSTAHQDVVRTAVTQMLVTNSNSNSNSKSKTKKAKGSRRGLLVFHGTGTGKTCTAALVIEALASSTTVGTISFVTTESALTLNPLDKIARCAVQRTLPTASTAIGSGRVRAVTFEALFKHVSTHVSTHVSKGDDMWSDLGALVIDEAHHLLEPRFLELRRALLAAPRTLIVVAMTATPGTTPTDTLELLDMLRPAGSSLYEFPETSKARAALKTRLRKERVIAYHDATDDAAHFAEVRLSSEHDEGAVQKVVESITAASGDRHLVWAPTPDGGGLGPSVAGAMSAGGVRYVELGPTTANVASVVRDFNRGLPPGVVIITDRGLGESVDLRGVKHIHVIDAELDAVGLQQVVGRAWRFCSHAMLPAQDWTIDVRLYHVSGSSTPNVKVERLEGEAARAQEAVLLLTAIVGEIATRIGIDATDATDEVVRRGAATLTRRAAKDVIGMWDDATKLRKEVDAMGRRLAESELRTLASVRDADRHLAVRKIDAEKMVAPFYTMLRESTI